MSQNEVFTRELKKILQFKNMVINEPMKNHTSFKVGGPVDILVTPENYEQLIDIVKLCNENNINYYIVGNGSNLLVKDGGIRGVVIKLCNLNKINVNENNIVVQSGALLSSVSNVALKNNLHGLEFACGIPGSIGGAVAMNAGAYDGEMSQVVEKVKVVDKDGNIKEFTNSELEFNYRMSVILKHNYIVLEVTFKLEKGVYENIKNRMIELNKRRKEKQPIEYPSAGSTFKRPKGYFTGKIIEDMGLKGMRVGGAEISKKHAGFIINRDNATAKDILDLINIVKMKVKEKYHIELNTEVRILGQSNIYKE